LKLKWFRRRIEFKLMICNYLSKKFIINIAIIQLYFIYKYQFPNILLFLSFNNQEMIQRVQSLFLLMVIIFNGILSFYLPLWITSKNQEIYALSQPVSISLFLLSVLITIITIFLFKKRKFQFVIGRINIILNFVLVGVFAYWTLSLPGEMDISKKGIGMLLPIISIVFIALANKAIKKDEDLVKSVDRLR